MVSQNESTLPQVQEMPSISRMFSKIGFLGFYNAGTWVLRTTLCTSVDMTVFSTFFITINNWSVASIRSGKNNYKMFVNAPNEAKKLIRTANSGGHVLPNFIEKRLDPTGKISECFLDHIPGNPVIRSLIADWDQITKGHQRIDGQRVKFGTEK